MIRKRRRTSTLLGVLVLTCLPVLLLQARLFAVRVVEVRGLPAEQAAQLRPLTRALEGRNLLALRLADAAKVLDAAGWVREAHIRKVLPSRLEITVKARRPVALYVGDRGEALMDSAGELYCGPLPDGPWFVLTGEAHGPAARALAALLSRSEGMERHLAGAHISPGGEVRFLDRAGHWLTVDLATAPECLSLFERLLEECPGYAEGRAVDIRRAGHFVITG